MTPIAVLFLVISIVVVWGGLLASILHLRAHPVDETDTDDDVGVLGQAGGATGPDGTDSSGTGAAGGDPTHH